MEGPSLYILQKESSIFIGKKVIDAKGYGKADPELLRNKIVTNIQAWGKVFLISFKGFYVRIHFGLFGSYRFNDPKKGINASLQLNFSNGELGCYIAHTKIVEGKTSDDYDWRFDMLSEEWDASFVKKALLEKDGNKLIGDLLLDPEIFTGVGNIIRNEVLYRTKVHPDSKLKNIPPAKLNAIIRETKHYSWEFVDAAMQKKTSSTFQIYDKSECPKHHPILKKVTGKTKRNSFICKICQQKY